MRVPSFIAMQVSRELYRDDRPFGVEVVGDPYDAFAPGAMNHPLRPLLRWSMVRQLRRQCARASAVAYVTETTLQRRYPCGAYGVGISDVHLPADAIVVGGDVLATHFSSVELDGSACLPRGKRQLRGLPVRLVTVVSLERPYKGVHHLLSALEICVRAGLDAALTVVGDGRLRPQLEGQAAKLGLSRRVRFAGQLQAGEAIRAHLDEADLFVLPSLTEGLPRAMVEAMARGLPCIGTVVGGVPELLGPAELVRPADPRGLAAKIQEIAGNEARMASLSARNIAKAREFSEDALCERRLAFYNHLRQVTEEWMARRNAGNGSLFRQGAR
jgi:glycosyltransferase involved in cell wall biosynthesis